MEIKHSNWFAAGPEIQRALLSLSDGAFRLYFYLLAQIERAIALGCCRRYISLLNGTARQKGPESLITDILYS
jgi:hypothetical protein